MLASVKGCPRCEGTHHALIFKQLRRPSSPIRGPIHGEAHPYTHWTMCPKTHEPMLYAKEVESPLEEAMAIFEVTA